MFLLDMYNLFSSISLLSPLILDYETTKLYLQVSLSNSSKQASLFMIKSDLKHTELNFQIAISLYEFGFERSQSKFNKEGTYCYTHMAHMTVLTKLTTQNLHVPVPANQLLEQVVSPTLILNANAVPSTHCIQKFTSGWSVPRCWDKK